MNPWWLRPPAEESDGKRKKGQSKTTRSDRGESERVESPESGGDKSAEPGGDESPGRDAGEPSKKKRAPQRRRASRGSSPRAASAAKPKSEGSGESRRPPRKRRRGGAKRGAGKGARGARGSKLALFCDIESMVLGAREANLGKPDAQLMVSFLRDLGEPAVVKAYADWKRHDDLREGFSAAGFDLVDIPAEGSVGAIAIAVQMTVDAMDVCHKQGGISTFVLLSGDRSFEPLVDRLKSNDRKVVGVAVGATSEPGFLENFDPFVSYESILEAAEAAEAAAEAERESDGAVTSEPLDEAAASASLDEATASVSLDASLPDASEVKTAQEGASDDLAERDVFELMLEVISEMEHRPRALLWGSKVKQAMKSKDPSFSENRYGFETFAELLEEAERRKVITLKREERSGTYIVTGFVRV